MVNREDVGTLVYLLIVQDVINLQVGKNLLNLGDFKSKIFFVLILDILDDKEG